MNYENLLQHRELEKKTDIVTFKFPERPNIKVFQNDLTF